MNTKTSPSYEDEVFKFFTQPENFETMLRVNEHADSVFKRITKDFLDTLKQNISEKLEGQSKGWVVEYSGKFENIYCKLWLYRRDWKSSRLNNIRPFFAVAFENLHLGEELFLGITYDKKADNNNSELLKRQIPDIKELANYNRTPSNDWWLCQMHPSNNFKSVKNLGFALPSNRADYIEELTLEALKLTEVLDEFAHPLIPKVKKENF
jgi:hypothetical protein